MGQHGALGEAAGGIALGPLRAGCDSASPHHRLHPASSVVSVDAGLAMVRSNRKLFRRRARCVSGGLGLLPDRVPSVLKPRERTPRANTIARAATADRKSCPEVTLPSPGERSRSTTRSGK